MEKPVSVVLRDTPFSDRLPEKGWKFTLAVAKIVLSAELILDATAGSSFSRHK